MDNKAPIIIKRKKIIAGGGHHGGAWKVAYADFVTAMMAFFMLMWLLNATTEQQRKGIADYFAPTIPINRISGGGDGMFGGDSIFSKGTMIRSGTGGSPFSNESGAGESGPDSEALALKAAQVAALNNIEEVLLGQGGESLVANRALRHIVTRVTDEGLAIEIFDLPDLPLFDAQTAVPEPILTDIAVMLSNIFAIVENPIAIKGHLAAQSVLVIKNDIWGLSSGRAETMRTLMEAGSFPSNRVARLSGLADRNPAVSDVTAVRNNRIEVVLLRSDL